MDSLRDVYSSNSDSEAESSEKEEISLEVPLPEFKSALMADSQLFAKNPLRNSIKTLQVDQSNNVVGNKRKIEQDNCFCGAIAKYKCPKCSVMSCSLKCVNAHKSMQQCDGKRNTAEFVPMSTFDDQQLLQDYSYLQDVSRFVDLSKRDPTLNDTSVKKIYGPRYQSVVRLKTFLMYEVQKHHSLISPDIPLTPLHLENIDTILHAQLLSQHSNPKLLTLIQKQCLNRGTILSFLPNSFQRRLNNTSTIKRKKIFWKIEWGFPKCNITHVDKSCDEEMDWKSAIEAFLGPLNDINYKTTSATAPLRHQLNDYLKLSDLNIIMEVSSRSDAKLYRQFSWDACIKESLKDCCLLENPSVLVVHNSDISSYDIISDADWEESSIATRLVIFALTKARQKGKGKSKKIKNNVEIEETSDLNKQVDPNTNNEQMGLIVDSENCKDTNSDITPAVIYHKQRSGEWTTEDNRRPKNGKFAKGRNQKLNSTGNTSIQKSNVYAEFL